MWRRGIFCIAAAFALSFTFVPSLYAASPLEVRAPAWPLKGLIAYVSKGLRGIETGGNHVYDETVSPPGPSAPQLPGTPGPLLPHEPGIQRNPALATFDTPACQPLEITKIRPNYMRLRDLRHKYARYELGEDWKKWVHQTAEECEKARKKLLAPTQPLGN